MKLVVYLLQNFAIRGGLLSRDNSTVQLPRGQDQKLLSLNENKQNTQQLGFVGLHD